MDEQNDDDVQSRGSLEFVEGSILDTIVPAATNLNIEEALSGSVEKLDEGNDSPLAAIPQRGVLFFGQCSWASVKSSFLLIHRS